jgi:hypothetical protein
MTMNSQRQQVLMATMREVNRGITQVVTHRTGRGARRVVTKACGTGVLHAIYGALPARCECGYYDDGLRYAAPREVSQALPAAFCNRCFPDGHEKQWARDCAYKLLQKGV